MEEIQKGQETGEASPRGVLEIPISGSDTDSIDRSSSYGSEKSSTDAPEKEVCPPDVAAEESNNNNNGNMQWKKFLGQVKKRSVKSFSTIPLLGGNGYDFSKKAFRKLGRNRSAEEAIDCGDLLMPKPSWKNYSYEELKRATDDFSSDKLIGKGGHAEVYKGFLDGQVVAVKKITNEQKNDEDRVGDYLSELGIIAHIEHQNAAKLVGFSADSGLHLVLHFCPHGSLATVLFGQEESLEWGARYKVAIGVAEGLQYLHCECPRRTIHRDITASNILLSENYEPQISDFGLAKWLPEKWVHHVVSPIEGTFGYMAPEYFMHGIVDEKIDVFAFGVLLLEIITGRRAVDLSSQSLVMWAKPLLETDNVKEIADPRLGETYDVTEMKRAMSTASSCIHHLPSKRPSMTRVVQQLRGENEVIEKQKSLDERSLLLLDGCDSDYTSTNYLKDLNRHRELIME